MLVVLLIAIILFPDSAKPESNLLDFDNFSISKYQFRFMSIRAINPDTLQASLDDHENLKVIARLKAINHLLKQPINFHATLENLFTTIKEFENSHCLLVIDNWQGVNIVQTSAIPLDHWT